MKINLLLLLLTLGISAGSSNSLAQGTAFTYQGHLLDGGAPANGNYDLQFSVRDALAGGNLIGSAQTVAPVTATDGQFTVTLDFGTGVFTGPARWLEIGVRTFGNAGAYTVLAPRQQVTAAPYAIQAGNAATVAAGAIGPAQLAPGAAAANLGTNVSTAASGSVVFSTDPKGSNLVSSGYVKIGSTTFGDTWNNSSSKTAPGSRSFHTAIWTGTDLIVWGGFNGANYLSDGARYNPASDTWAAISTTNAPSARAYHTAVWTGSQMIVWGGFNGTGLADGALYNPVSNTWVAISSANAPAARYVHTAVWTGTSMIVWGGENVNGSAALGDGALYNPSNDSWSATATASAPSARWSHTAVYSGTEMIVWGGYNGAGFFGDGARFNPVSGVWTALPGSGSPSARVGQSAVWTGSQMIVWGGFDGTSYLANGASFSPNGNRWSTVSSSSAPAIRRYHTAVWDGGEMIVFGGFNGTSTLDDGGRYEPTAGVWTALTTTGAPKARVGHAAAWAGYQMLIHGGGTTDGAGNLNDIDLYLPGAVWLFQKP